jgi:hypothetical protein
MHWGRVKSRAGKEGGARSSQMSVLGWDNGSGSGEDAGRRGLYTPALSSDHGALEEGLWERSCRPHTSLYLHTCSV